MKLLAVLAVAAAAASSADAFLKFDQASLQLAVDQASGAIQVSLKEKPSSRVVVYFDAAKTRFDKCALEYSPENWDKPQSLSVVSEPFASLAPKERSLPITFQAYTDSCDEKLQGKTIELPTKRDSDKEGRCAVTGDPHYDTFDNTALYHYQGVGDFYLVKSEAVSIQARQGKCFGKASCIVGLAVRYGSASFVIDANKDMNSCVQTVTHMDGLTVSRTRSGTITSINISMNSGSSLKVDIVSDGKNRYMNTYVNLACHLKGKVGGLCGTYDGKADNDFTGSDGKVYSAKDVIAYSASDMFNDKPQFNNSDLKKFAESWRVPDADNLFKGKCNPGKFPIEKPVTQCRRPAPGSVKCERPMPSTTLATTTTTQGISSSASTTVPASSSSSSATTQQSSVSSATSSSTASASTGTTSSAASTGSSSSSTAASSSSASTSTASSTTAQTSSVSSATTTSTAPGSSATTTRPATSATTTIPATKTKQPCAKCSYVPLPPTCPKPIVVVPIPPGYKKDDKIPRYDGKEPELPKPVPVPECPRKVLEDAAKNCAARIPKIDGCSENVQKFITACEADVMAQMNPEGAIEVHKFSYTQRCARVIVDQAQEPDMSIALPARETAKKHCFGANKCEDTCLQCSERGCIECKDRENFEVQGGKCVRRQKIEYQQEYFMPKPEYKKLDDNEVAPTISDEDAQKAAENPAYNPGASVPQDSIQVTTEKLGTATVTDETAGKKGESSAMRFALSSVAGVVALAASLML
ncbi:hypothetical protein BCR44DRAFT_60665 [Catenaria anguillulae PL171]|uniref:VWFD domain-containing protein n=1 Tax=Catenaria anguillulae PL171 TaxID=765915 RepID=A0A1Y2I003_9FUNG|nr:hypothetical protein BCR44DRAFT_60665 [Catenaria anguillulae PL171]